WIVSAQPPYAPRLVTADASFHADGIIRAYQKGRGLGDCAWRMEWAWDGRDFVPAFEATTGLCRLVADGGAWELPTRVSRILRWARGAGSGQPAGEPGQGAFPCELRRRFVKARRRVIVETVRGAGVDVGLVGLAVLPERRLEIRPGGVDAGIVLGEVQQHRSLDARYILRPCLAAVERNGRGQLREGHGGGMAHAPAIAEAGDAHLAGAVPVAQQVLDAGEEVVEQLFRVHLLLQGAALVVV